MEQQQTKPSIGIGDVVVIAEEERKKVCGTLKKTHRFEYL